jgi:hypothetical protein
VEKKHQRRIAEGVKSPTTKAVCFDAASVWSKPPSAPSDPPEMVRMQERYIESRLRQFVMR